MQQYTTTVYKNCGPGRFRGLQHDDPIAEVDTSFTIRALDSAGAAEETYVVGQKEIRADATGKRFPFDVYSVSTGDLVKVVGSEGMTFWAVERFGCREIVEPTNPIVPLVGNDMATTRGVTS